MRPHWALAELGLEYETREIVPRTASMRDPAFLSVSQRGKVPILEHGDLVIGESGAIVFHLAEQFRDRVVLAPLSGTRERAIFDDLCLFALTELDARLYTVRMHEGLPETYGEAPAAVKAAREYFARQSGEMARRLDDGRPYLMDAGFSAADILLATCLAWAQFIGVELDPVLAEYQARVTARDGFQRAFRMNFTPEAMAALRAD
jgi:glutathione S-transferase